MNSEDKMIAHLTRKKGKHRPVFGPINNAFER
jgi:hypothetical protein